MARKCNAAHLRKIQITNLHKKDNVNYFPAGKEKGSSDEMFIITREIKDAIYTAMNPAKTYALCFPSEHFVCIAVEELKTKVPAEKIQLFFEELDRIKDVSSNLKRHVVLSVKDSDNPRLDAESFLQFEYKDSDRVLKIPASLFWFCLPKLIKKPYYKVYPETMDNFSYERLKRLFKNLGVGLESEGEEDEYEDEY